MVTIRRELVADASAVYAVEQAAFGREDEARLVDRLRDQVKPYLSFVACYDRQIIGHALFTPVSVAGTPSWTATGLGPVAVSPAWQRQGVGDRLVRHGLTACRAAGFDVVFVLGHPSYYPRFGFTAAGALGLRCQWEVPDDAFMVFELEPGSLRGRQGIVHYHPAFEGV